MAREGCCAPIDDALARLHTAVKSLKRELLAVYYATQDGECPLASKIIAAIAVSYALSPIDLIPDFIPVLGIIDDLLLLLSCCVPSLIWLSSPAGYFAGMSVPRARWCRLTDVGTRFHTITLVVTHARSSTNVP